MLDNVSIYHSSIRLNFEKIIYFDPFKIENELYDADMIFITHEHYDHYSKEDIDKVIKDSTIIIAPKSMQGQINYPNVKYVEPEKEYEENGIKFSTVRAYNVGKKFHPKEKDWLGYIVTLNDTKYYVAGDTDATDEAKKVVCDVAFLPCGGTYTMDYKEAAELANTIKPKIAIPTHYGAIVGSKYDGEKFLKLLKL